MPARASPALTVCTPLAVLEVGRPGGWERLGLGRTAGEGAGEARAVRGECGGRLQLVKGRALAWRGLDSPRVSEPPWGMWGGPPVVPLTRRRAVNLRQQGGVESRHAVGGHARRMGEWHMAMSLAQAQGGEKQASRRAHHCLPPVSGALLLLPSIYFSTGVCHVQIGPHCFPVCF